jgi:S1-C subfamily serine protease
VNAAHAWDIDKMNQTIDQTNIVLGMDGQPFCSGTVISAKHRLVLTAAHCVKDATGYKTVEITDPDTGEVKEKRIKKYGTMQVWQNQYLDYAIVSTDTQLVKVLATNDALDVAIMQVVDPNWKAQGEAVLETRKFKVKRGQNVYVVGNPAGMFDASVSSGIVMSDQRQLAVGSDELTDYFQVDAAIIGGNSGGGVFSNDGKLIGVTSAALRSSTIGFIVPVSAIYAILKTAKFEDVGE